MFSKNRKGFTLIELLIVIVIIGILAGVVLSVLNPAKTQQRANESVLRANTEKTCLALFACANSTTDKTQCDSVTEIGANAVSGVALSGTDTITVTGTLGSCTFACDYTFSTGVITNMRKTGTCVID